MWALVFVHKAMWKAQLVLAQMKMGRNHNALLGNQSCGEDRCIGHLVTAAFIPWSEPSWTWKYLELLTSFLSFLELRLLQMLLHKYFGVPQSCGSLDLLHKALWWSQRDVYGRQTTCRAAVGRAWVIVWKCTPSSKNCSLTEAVQRLCKACKITTRWSTLAEVI